MKIQYRPRSRIEYKSSFWSVILLNLDVSDAVVKCPRSTMKFGYGFEIRGGNFVVYIGELDGAYSAQESLRTPGQLVGA